MYVRRSRSIWKKAFSAYTSTMTDWDQSTGLKASRSPPLTPPTQHTRLSVEIPITSVVFFTLRSMSVPERLTRRASMAQARAPKKAEASPTLHAGFGFP